MTANPSHPPSVIQAARRLILDRHLLVPGQHVLVAVSGGPDSQALLSVLAHLASDLHISLSACGVDHGLRAEAPDELLLSRQLCDQFNVPMTTVKIHVPEGGNLMERARDARFEALQRVASDLGCQRIALGHHADDRAETVLLRMLRGAGPHGLAVMPARSGIRIRPLLSVRKREIYAYLKRHAIPFALAPSNRSSRFLRVRVRTEVLPLLEQLSPNVVQHLWNLAEDLTVEHQSSDLRPLGRSHLQAIARAIRSGNTRALISLPTGVVAHLSEDQKHLVLDEPTHHRGSQPTKPA